MSEPRKDPSVRRSSRPSRHPALVAKRRLRRRIALGVLLALLAAPLFVKFGSDRKPGAAAQAAASTSGETGIAPLPEAVQPVTRERLLERTAAN